LNSTAISTPSGVQRVSDPMPAKCMLHIVDPANEKADIITKKNI
jgi:hypothetical protein